MTGRAIWVAGGAMLALLAGCTVGPEYRTPEVSLPSGFRGTGDTPGSAEVLDASLRQWWVGFGDPVLTGLVERALASNLDLESAAARIDRSRALLGLSRADQWPSATGGGEATRARRSDEVRSGPGAGGGTSNTFGLDMGASWEIDVFGGRRRAVQAARAELEATEADWIATRIAVTGEVADAYLARQGAADRLRIARENVESFRDTLRLTESRLRAELTSELDAALAAADLDAALATIPGLEAELGLQENRIAALLATTPGELEAWLGESAGIPEAPIVGDRGVPVDLLRRRPDVMSAERRVASASATIGERVAEYFPRFTLSGAVGVSSAEADDLLTSSAGTWSFGPAFQWRLLDFARIDAAIDAARADERGAIAEYRRSIVDAVRDTEDAALRVDSAAEEIAARATALASRERALMVAERQYSAGLSEFLPVLDARRGVNQARTDLSASRERRVRAVVGLYRALGGGWEVGEARGR